MLAVKGGMHQLQDFLAAAQASGTEQSHDADAETEQYAGMEEDNRWITPWGKDVTDLCWTSSTGGFGSTQWTKNGWILDDFSMRELQKEFPDENLEKEANNKQSTLASPVSAEYRRGGGVVLPIAGQPLFRNTVQSPR